jgi:hypothetical protein
MDDACEVLRGLLTVYQWLLKQQCSELQHSFGCPAVVVDTVKRMWHSYLAQW